MELPLPNLLHDNLRQYLPGSLHPDRRSPQTPMNLRNELTSAIGTLRNSVRLLHSASSQHTTAYYGP